MQEKLILKEKLKKELILIENYLKKFNILLNIKKKDRTL